jgi:predicted O-methyltransferase YrrM
MSQQRWGEVDRYIDEHLLGEDPALESALEASEQAGLPPIAVTPAQGKLLHLLARMQGARMILELGTLGGYSTIWLARALPDDGRLVTLELDPGYARVAAANVELAGLAGLVELKVGRAIEQLDALVADGVGPFDLIFLDADKQGTPEYFARALELSRPGTVVITDNSIRDGELVNGDSEEPGVQGMRRFHEMLAADRRGAARVSATTIQTVGAKGYDGFTLAIVDG